MLRTSNTICHLQKGAWWCNFCSTWPDEAKPHTDNHLVALFVRFMTRRESVCVLMPWAFVLSVDYQTPCVFCLVGPQITKVLPD